MPSCKSKGDTWNQSFSKIFLCVKTQKSAARLRQAMSRRVLAYPQTHSDSSGHPSVDETRGGQKKIISPLVNVCC